MHSHNTYFETSSQRSREVSARYVNAKPQAQWDRINIQLTSNNSVKFCKSLYNYISSESCLINRNDTGRKKNLYFTEGKDNGIAILYDQFVTLSSTFPLALDLPNMIAQFEGEKQAECV